MAPSKSGDPPATVLTPAGKVPADKVRHVRPGQKVIRNPDGSFSVAEDHDESPEERKGQSNDKSGPDSGRL